MSQKNDSFSLLMKGYDLFAVEERIDLYRRSMRCYEAGILDVTGDVGNRRFYHWHEARENAERVMDLLRRREECLSRLFELHCNKREVEMIANLNDRLYC